MKYTSPTNLADLTLSADRAQAFLDATLDDLERMPPSSVEFRLAAMDKVTAFIYRLTGVRKTLCALRASFNRNTKGLRELNEMVRNLHKQMLGLQSLREDLPIQNALSAIQNPKSPQNSLRPARFSPGWLPSTDELIPEPRLPQSAMEALGAPASLPASGSGAPALPTLTPLCSSVSQSVSESVSSTQSTPSTPTESKSVKSEQSVDESSPQPDLSSVASAKADPASALLARWPESITNPDFKLPRESNRAADYAPLLKLDIVPQVRTIPILPLAAPDLDARIDAQFAQLTDTCVTLRADMREQDPNCLSNLVPYTPAEEPPAELIDDPPNPITQTAYTSHESHASHSSHPNNAPDPPDSS